MVCLRSSPCSRPNLQDPCPRVSLIRGSMLVSGDGLGHESEVPGRPAPRGVLQPSVPGRLMEKARRPGVPLRDDVIPVAERRERSHGVRPSIISHNPVGHAAQHIGVSRRQPQEDGLLLLVGMRVVGKDLRG
eukprot:8734888-Lingulodinium_polyedra.AAC.1